MINTVAVSFSVYDENGVIMLSDVVTLKDFNAHFSEGVKNTPYEQAQKILKGSVRVLEIQNIRDSVLQERYLTPLNEDSCIPVSDIISCPQDVSPDIFLSKKLSYFSDKLPGLLQEWYNDLWGVK